MSAIRRTLLLLAVLATASSSVFGQGVFLTGVGAVNRSMGGAATAAPIDSMGALHWNPASISGLQSNEVAFSLEAMLIKQELTASMVTGEADSGAVPLPAIGWVHHIEDSKNTVGLGIYSFAGFAQNMPAVLGHPILDPPGPDGLLPGGLGPMYSEAQFLQIVPTISHAVTDRLSIGFAPAINMGRVELTPIPFLTPSFGQPGAGTRWSWGIGCQAGIYYVHNDAMRFGFSIKSPQWFEEFETQTLIGGAPAVSKLKVDLPMILSAGMAFTGLPDWTLAVDFRYFDYKNTDGFGRPGDVFGTELHWDNVFAVAMGAQRKVTENLYLRAGYTFNTSPIDNDTIGVNFATPLIQQHVMGLGGSYNLAENVDFTLSYNQIFESEVTGPSPFTLGNSQNKIATYSIAAAVTVRYGNGR